MKPTDFQSRVLGVIVTGVDDNGEMTLDKAANQSGLDTQAILRAVNDPALAQYIEIDPPDGKAGETVLRLRPNGTK